MSWTPDQLSNVLEEMRARRGDTTSIEVKRATGGLPQLADTICAFANMPNGGTIILGVDEASGTFDVTGVNDVAALEAGLASMARNKVRPEPHLEFQTFTLERKKVLIAHVSPLRLTDRPAYVGQQAYLRQSDGDYAMQPHEIRMIEIAKLHSQDQVDYDLQPATGRTQADLIPELVRAYAAAVRARDHRLKTMTDDQVLRLTNVVNSDGQPTLAGLYALGAYPQGQYPALMATAAVQLPGGEGQARNRNLQDFSGPVAVLLENVMDWVATNLDTIHRYRPDGHMQALPELPLDAVRELIANALVHRDLGPNTLGTGKGIQVRLTPRNLFIQSPGGLRGVSLSQLNSVEHAQAAVNQHLYQIAKRLRTADGASVIEGEGGGIQQVFRSTSERGLPRPQLIDTGVQFKALLWRPKKDAHPDSPAQPPAVIAPQRPSEAPCPVDIPRSSSPTRNEPAVLSALAAASAALTIHDLISQSGLNDTQVRYALQQPILDGIVVMDGGQGHKSTTYRLRTLHGPDSDANQS